MEYDISWLDVSFIGQITPARRWVTTFDGGVGYANVSADVSVTDPPFNTVLRGVRDNSFTLHAGVGGKLDLTEVLYLRLTGRVKWYESRDRNPYDGEIAAGVGWKGSR